MQDGLLIEAAVAAHHADEYINYRVQEAQVKYGLDAEMAKNVVFWVESKQPVQTPEPDTFDAVFNELD